MIFERFVNDC